MHPEGSTAESRMAKLHGRSRHKLYRTWVLLVYRLCPLVEAEITEKAAQSNSNMTARHAPSAQRQTMRMQYQHSVFHTTKEFQCMLIVSLAVGGCGASVAVGFSSILLNRPRELHLGDPPHALSSCRYLDLTAPTACTLKKVRLQVTHSTCEVLHVD